MASIDWASLRILVVDDNANFRRLTKTILEAVKVAEIAEVGSASEALERLPTFSPHVILSDWRMDEMDGLDFVAKLRADGSTLPVVMMTGYADDDFERRARDAGVDELLEKPVTPKNVITGIARALNARQDA